jgi:hypothetical protein
MSDKAPESKNRPLARLILGFVTFGLLVAGSRCGMCIRVARGFDFTISPGKESVNEAELSDRNEPRGDARTAKQKLVVGCCAAVQKSVASGEQCQTVSILGDSDDACSTGTGYLSGQL